MEPFNVQKFEYKKLVTYTDNFSESNYIGRFQFGKLYRGQIPNLAIARYLVVKIWEAIPETYNYKPGDNKLRLMKEIILLRHEMVLNHPGIVKLYGFCIDGEKLCVVYKVKAFDSVYNLIPKDGFTWLQRIKAAFGLASVLKFLHSGKSAFYKPFIVQNLDAAHIVLDEEYNPKLCDFGMISGGIFPCRRTYSDHQHVIGCYGYTDIDASSKGHCSNKQDVFAFGVILLSLISKRVYTEEDRRAGAPFVYEWAIREFEANADELNEATDFSLVHKSLAGESDFCPGDGHKITMLALECVVKAENERPTMKQIFRSMRKLEVVKQHADYVGANKVLCPYDPCDVDW
ncbi:probable serine/threonine-protein kinase nak [Phtheirospermum japonicum]|uniref:Probable serine/threonine-protein kinase nak n=1 Tax=Phtheirospermum japonicum TaxID=374723 RepID=A0A830DBV9_9LAMI|nr:probable serine/threonine-protein kinase nak [Phtheirospermum japonicum]